MDIDQSDHGSQNGEGEQEAWQKTRAGKRIAELKEVEENIAALLHFAGCTLASLHPDPLSSFTSRELAVEDDEGEDDGEGGEGGEKAQKKPPPGEDKLADFGKYAEGYYATLNDIQLALRTSIRHLRVSRVSPAPLLDPSFASLATSSSSSSSASQVGVGGVALGELLNPLDPARVGWDGKGERERVQREEEGKAEGGEKVSVAALELEREAWAEVVRRLEAEQESS
ncbi:hypothetical protein JCM6882_005842 [Rhodosporidiobolus microsporus]